MPTVFRFNGIRFHFFANEGIPREPIYISEQTVLLRIVPQRRTEIERAWNEFFSQGS